MANYDKALILSASRMTDMPAFYPVELIAGVSDRLSRGLKIHTLMLWTKHPASLFRPPLAEALESWKRAGIQIAIQLTMTGFGGVGFLNHRGETVRIEPNVPRLADALASLPRIVSLVGHPHRISLRFDPVMRIASGYQAETTNLDLLDKIVAAAGQSKIKRLIYSFLEPGVYRKVDRRFLQAALDILPFSLSEKLVVSHRIERLSGLSGMVASACCVAGLPGSACVDGRELMALSESSLFPALHQPRSRPGCGCTQSTDIGGWPPRICHSGCLYCYARPAMDQKVFQSVD